MSERGYKVFNPDWTCRPRGTLKQYTCPGKFEEEIDIAVCRSGMHYCKNAADCFNYYKFDPKNKVAEVIAYGKIVEDGDKSCTDKLEIVREIPWEEVLSLVNTGTGNTYHNSGYRNSGDWNSGDHNSGSCNSGDWNKCNYSSGCFNTVEANIILFNKPSEWTYEDWLNSEARSLMLNIQLNSQWIDEDSMTDEEKDKHPEYETTGGYLKQVDNKQICTKWWNDLSDSKRDIIRAIPNFDKEIFSEITGIDKNLL